MPPTGARAHHPSLAPLITFQELDLLSTTGSKGSDLSGVFSMGPGQGQGCSGSGRACIPSSIGIAEVSTTTLV